MILPFIVHEIYDLNADKLLTALLKVTCQSGKIVVSLGVSCAMNLWRNISFSVK